MLKVGDKVRILENSFVSDSGNKIFLHHFNIGDIVEVTDVCDENSVIAEGDNDPWEQLLVNTKDLKQFERVEE